MPAYVFSQPRRRITSARFPHSGIHGSKAIQRLTVAYRSRSRPSSTLGAKASTMCPYYLDGDRTLRVSEVFGDTRRRRGLSSRRRVATVQFSRAAGRRPGGFPDRSLKTQQHAPAKARRYAELAGPGSVDVLGRTVGDRRIGSDRAAPEGVRRAAGDGAVPYGPREGLPRKEVIQPQLPLRLPCYDFTPVTSPTFDGSLP